MAIRILFATDFVCPYCIVAKHTLLQAIGDRDDVEIELLPIELTMPGKPQVDTYHDEARKEKWAKSLIPFCESLGLPVHMPPHVIPRPYTHLAWQGYYFAKDSGKAQEYAAKMYDAYFIDELDIGKLEVLEDCAEAIGLDKTAFRETLLSGKYSDYVLEQVALTRKMEVTGVPTIWINDIRLSGDMYTKEDFEGFLAQADAGDSGFVGEDGFSCGPDGC